MSPPRPAPLLRPPRNPPACLFQLDPGGRRPQLQLLPHHHIPGPTRSSPPLSPTTSTALAAAAEEASSGPGDCFALSGPGTSLGIPNQAPDVHLFYVEVIGEGEAWGQVRPLQASVGGVSVVSPPPCLHHAPLKLRPTAAGPGTFRPLGQPSSWRWPGRMLNSCWGSHGQLSCHSIHTR